MTTLTIGMVAKQSGVGIETVRFYEKQGLIAEPPRKSSGYRQYPDDTVARIRFIKRAKELGFSLVEIKELLSLRSSPDAQCSEVLNKAQAKILDIDNKIKTLQSMRTVLSQLVEQCPSQAPASDCPILDAIEPEV